MATYIQRERNASVPRQQQQQYPSYPAPMASPPWQQNQRPSTPPSALPTNGRVYSPAATRSPQMIKCSDCACLVPLMELGEHTCRGATSGGASSQQQQMPQERMNRQNSAEGRLGRGFQQQERGQGPSRMAPIPLKVNISQAQNAQVSPALSTPYHIPLPRSPASLGPSPTGSPNNLSPSHLNHSRKTSASGSEHDSSSYAYVSHSPSPRSDLSASNNAGIGARGNGNSGSQMPFFEKYQRVYGGNSGGGSISSSVGSNETNPTTAGSLSPPPPKTPITPAWPTRKESQNNIIAQVPQYKEYQQEERPVQPQEPVQKQSHTAHKREESASSQSDSLSTSNSDHLLNYLDSPDTSPDFPTSPVFRANEEEGLGQQEKQRPASVEQGNNTQTEEDIIASYPTPQPTFSGRFGDLVIDDSYENNSSSNSSAFATPDTQAMRSQSRGLPMSHSTPDSLARLANGEGDQLSSGREQEKAIGHSKSLNQQRRRSRTNGWNAAAGQPRGNGSAASTPRLGGLFAARNAQKAVPSEGASSGLGLDACLDDLLKEMNRESIDSSTPDTLRVQVSTSASAGSRSPSPSSSSSSRSFANEQQSQVQSRPNPPLHCDSCVTPIPSSRKPIRKDGQTFCKECYIELYLPKCRKCTKPIEGKAIGSGDGKVKGKFHAACFSCFECSAPFPTGDFYVYEQRPYCGQHYHELNGTLCANAACTEVGIEGPCVSLVGEEGGNGGRYHPSCFICSHPACTIALDQYHYILSGLPYCESHAHELEDYPTSSGGNTLNDTASSSSSHHQSERRRSRSLDTPTSITALRKKAGSPSYFSRNANGGGSQRLARNNNGPPPVSGTRRAEKRRTVIQDVTRR